MARTPRKTPAKTRNLAAKALRTPLFRARVLPHPDAYKRKMRFSRKLVDAQESDE